VCTGDRGNTRVAEPTDDDYCHLHGRSRYGKEWRRGLLVM
jgi:hypothetical protein